MSIDSRAGAVRWWLGPHGRERAGGVAFQALDRLPAPLLFVTGAISIYVGAALAVNTFASVPAPGVAWLRVVGAAGIMLAWRRPWRGEWGVRRFWLTAAFGSALAAMNLSYYLSIERLPMGTAVAIEFLGPVVVAAAGSRSRRQVAALVIAVGGVALLADVQWQGSPSGVGFALLAAGCWALYITLGAKVAALGDGIDSLAAGFALGAVAIAPVAAPFSGPAFTDAGLLLLCLSLGLISNVIPYALDQVVMRKVPPSIFALLLSLLPATAAVIGLIMLGQVPVTLEAVGILLVVIAVAVRGR